MFGSSVLRCEVCTCFVGPSGTCKRCSKTRRIGLASKRKQSLSPVGCCVVETKRAYVNSSNCEDARLDFADCLGSPPDSIRGSPLSVCTSRVGGCGMEFTPLTHPETGSCCDSRIDCIIDVDDVSNLDAGSQLGGNSFSPAVPFIPLDSVDASSVTGDGLSTDMSRSTRDGSDVDVCELPIPLLPNNLPWCNRVPSAFCANCRREDIGDQSVIPMHLRVNLREFAVAEITNYERRWITFDKSCLGSSVWLCLECSNILLLKKRDERRLHKRPAPWSCVWPVYMWKLLCHEEMLQRFGSDALHWIPRSTHRLWEKSLILELPGYYSIEKFNDYNNSIAIVVDVTQRKKDFKDILSRNKLGEIKRGCNEFLMPTILCPWGCTAYLHDGGSVSYDAIINQFFPFVDFAGSIATSCEKANVESARSDFLDTKLDMHLYNSEWTVHPSIEFVPGKGPVVLTCDTHKNGTAEKYFHLPKSDCCLPAYRSDVLSHAVISARVLHRTKAFHYSTTYQLNKC